MPEKGGLNSLNLFHIPSFLTSSVPFKDLSASSVIGIGILLVESNSQQVIQKIIHTMLAGKVSCGIKGN